MSHFALISVKVANADMGLKNLKFKLNVFVIKNFSKNYFSLLLGHSDHLENWLHGRICLNGSKLSIVFQRWGKIPKIEDQRQKLKFWCLKIGTLTGSERTREDQIFVLPEHKSF